MKLCPRCKKEFFVKGSSKFGKKTLLTGVCGHIVSAEKLIQFDEPAVVSEELFVNKYTEVTAEHILALRKHVPLEDKPHASLTVKSVDGYKLFPFQADAVQKAEKANFSCLFEYQMGLGKTPIADTILNLHPELLNALIVCKGSIVWQHFKELIRWNGGQLGEITIDPLTWTSQVIGSSSDTLFPIFKVYITSYDMIRRLDLEDLKKLNLKTVILDECQKISNTKSKRSQSLRELIDELGIKNKIALSGTPIKNAPIEFYSVLNILRPDKFWSKENFEHDWVDYKMDRKTGKYKPSGIRNIEYFHEYTKDFVFRCTRDEVKEQIGLSVTEPFRDFKYIDIDKDLKKDYKKTEDEFNDFFISHELEDKAYSFADYSHILALFSRMRHLSGLSKISWAEEFVSEWLASRVLTVEELIENEDKDVKERKLEPKLAIFTHHIDVAKFLLSCINNVCAIENYDWKPLYLPSGLPSQKQDDIQYQFNFGPSRILVASTLGSGEGINLQHNCSDAVMMERQWNPANEEQAESRFIRIGQKADLVTVTYPTVLGTIDEYFTELIEKKRHMLKEIKSGKTQHHQWDEQATVMDLAKAIIQKRGGKRWSY